MLIKVEQAYTCPYRHCYQTYNSLAEAESCLDSHNVVFIVEEKGLVTDCWGRQEVDWVTTNLIYKHYKDVKFYDESPDYRVIIQDLL